MIQTHWVIATRNVGKLREFREMLQPLGIDLSSTSDYGEIPEIEESGATFAENSEIKARTVAELTKTPVIADDSGLCVEALNGAPGVRSARYAGDNASDHDNNRKLIASLQAIHATVALEGHEQHQLLSKAEYVCDLALVIPGNHSVLHMEGRCSGYIIAQPHGCNGFGYDPHFYVPDRHLTMAELTAADKNRISHRASALLKLLGWLENQL